MFKVTMLPAEDGDSFFVEVGAKPYRILIDGGRTKTANGPLATLINNLTLQDETSVDLVVLTHVDADHIEGLLSFIKTRGKALTKSIWFNGYQALCAAANIKHVMPGDAPDVDDQPTTLSILQGKKLTTQIEERGWAWNTGWNEGAVMIEPSGPLPVIDLPGGARLTLLSPQRSNLAEFRRAWGQTIREEIEGQGHQVMRGTRGPAHLPGRNVAHYASLRDNPDRALPNATSIAFVLEFGGKQALFTGDANPDVLAAALERLQPGGEPVYFDLIKVAHHGSSANNTSPLIARLASKLWLFSSNGRRHGHPEPEAIARVLLTKGEKRLIFNYRSGFSEAWEDHVAEREHNYVCQFPASEDDATVIDLLSHDP